MYRPYRAWLVIEDGVAREGQARPLNRVVMQSSSGGLAQRLDPFRPAARRFPLRGFECGEDDGGSALDDLQTLCEKCGVSMIQTESPTEFSRC